MSLTIYPAGLAARNAMLEAYMQHEAQAVAARLSANLSQAGSGIQYKNASNRSSSESEYPAEQSGATVGSVDARRVGFGVWKVGLWDTPEYVIWLEYKPPSRGGRPIIHKFLSEVVMGP